MKRLLQLIIFFSFFYSLSQTSKRLDSLLHISHSQEDTTLIKTLNHISWEFRNIQLDSASRYAKKALSLAQEVQNEKAIAASYHNLAAAFEAKSNLDSAGFYYKKSLKIRLDIKDTAKTADTYNNLGMLEDTRGNYDTALEYYFNALKIYEAYENKLNDFEKIPMVLVNIGIVYKKQKEYTKVLDYYQKALDIYRENKFKIGEAIVTGNIGSVLIKLMDYEASIKHSQKGLELYNELGYKRYVPYMLSNMAIAQDSLKLLTKSQSNFEEAVKLFEEDKNLYELVHAKLGLSNNLKKQKKIIEAGKHAYQALKIAQDKGYKEWEVKAYRILADLEKVRSNYKKYSEYLEIYTLKKDSLFEDSKTKTIFELEAKYETEKKEKEILSQRAEIAEKELKLDRNKNQILGLIALAIVLSILGCLLYNQQKLKNKQLQKENELKEALIEIETHNKLQEQRLRISRDLHDNIGAQLTFIISSIENLQYGFKIANNQLKDKLINISDFAKDTIYELRDTIWAMNKNEITLDDLRARISNFIDKADLSSNNLNFNINVQETISRDLVFSSVLGMNIYRIIQEAVNNAIKYAEASNIEVQIQKKGDKIEFSITDDGRGFDVESVEEGNGLNYMKKRAQNINADISYISNKGKGTEVILKL